jgi:hypothetical protein
MRLHPRREVTVKADLEFREFFNQWQRRHDLTHGETIRILAQAIDTEGRYMVRQERHPDDPDKKGDEE